jgi:hypothetical protein
MYFIIPSYINADIEHLNRLACFVEGHSIRALFRRFLVNSGEFN